MTNRTLRPTAFLAILALAACSGGGSPSTPAPIAPQTGSAILSTIVGIGDSLTFGEQANGELGVATTNPISILPGNLVPPTQENGWWALMYEQAKGMTAAQMAASATSPLPLINAPGLGAQLVPSNPPPFAASHSPCDTFNQSAFSLGTAGGTRANPGSTIYNLGIPGLTMHEALYMVAPLTAPASPPSCAYASNPADPTAGGLQSLVNAESNAFYPVMLGFAGKIQNLDEVDAAVSLHPTLTTVWLGANDLLKFIFSAGKSPASDTPAQMQTDLTAIIQRLQNAGSKVVVANLPDVLSTPQFFQGGATLTATLTQFLELEGVPAAIAPTAAGNVSANLQTTYGVSGNGYLTESGFFTTLTQTIAAIQAGNFNPTPSLNGAAGLGSLYLPDAFAAQAQGLNTAYNASIAAAASATGAPLVDIHSIFVQIKAAGGIPINPPKCCSLAFGGGLISFDGLHPSNTGYAEIANAFIGTIDAAFGLSVAPLSNAQIGAIYATDPYAPH